MVTCRDTLEELKTRIENSEIVLKDIISDDVISINKFKCSKCGGSSNFKTPENSRRTCLVCFGKGYLNI